MHIKLCRPARFIRSGFASRLFSTLVLAVFGLGACVQANPGSGAKQQVSAPVATEPAVRVIINLRNGALYRDSGFLERIGRAARTRISYVASVSADTHVYFLRPDPGQTSGEALKKLAELPEVKWVEPDQILTPAAQK